MHHTQNQVPHPHRRQLMCALAGALLVRASFAASAPSDWKPSKPIRIIVPFSPGGGADVLARIAAQGIGDRLGQPVIVENKPGATGALASDYVYQAPPDGYTLLAATFDTQSINPHVNAVKFETLNFQPIAGIGATAYVLMGSPELPAHNLSELVALARTRGLTYSSAGAGSALHVFAVVFGHSARIDNLLHVPYQGAAPALQALLASQVDFAMVPMAIAVQHTSKLKVYAVTSAQRDAALPNVPSLKELGFAPAAVSWAALVAPPGTPSLVTETIARATIETMSEPAVRARLRAMGTESMTQSRVDFARFYADEYRDWGRSIATANISKNSQ